MTDNLTPTKNENIRYSEKCDDKGEKYWQVEDNKDIFKGLSTNAEIEKAAFDYIIGRRDKNSVVETIGRKQLRDYIRREVANGNLVRIKNRGNNSGESTSPIKADYVSSTSTTNSLSQIS